MKRLTTTNEDTMTSESITLKKDMYIIRLVYLVAFVDMTTASMVVTVLASYLKDVAGLSASTAGVVSSLYGVVQFFSSPIAGAEFDRRGFGTVMSFCLFACFFAYSLLAVDFWIFLIVSRLLAGCFKHTQNLSKTMVGALSNEEQKLVAFGRLNSMGNLAFIFAPSLAGWLAAKFGYSFVFVLVAIGFGLNALIVYLNFPLMPSPVSDAPKISRKSIGINNNALSTSSSNPIRKLITHFQEVDWTSQWDLMMIRFLQSFVILLYRANFNWLMSDKYEVGPAAIGYLTSIQGVVAFFSSFYANNVIQLWSTQTTRVLVHCCFLLTVALVGMRLAPSFLIYGLFLGLLNCASSWLRVITIDLTTQRCVVDDIGAVLGVAASVIAISRAICPAVGGVLHDFDRESPTVMCAVVSGVTVLIAQFASVKNQRLYAIRR
uniref:Major facilitator superfamily (MFS) profile domain-containing protein n=1 Tax=Plectus sambesii TaxID=2011161 RepID=A0A914VTL5_9BILA